MVISSLHALSAAFSQVPLFVCRAYLSVRDGRLFGSSFRVQRKLLHLLGMSERLPSVADWMLFNKDTGADLLISHVAIFIPCKMAKLFG